MPALTPASSTTGTRSHGYGAALRRGPVVASVGVAVALVAAGVAGISAFVGDASTDYRLVHLDGMVGESMVVLAGELVDPDH